MRGISIFQKPHYREFRTMRGSPMRGLPVVNLKWKFLHMSSTEVLDIVIPNSILQFLKIFNITLFLF